MVAMGRNAPKADTSSGHIGVYIALPETVMRAAHHAPRISHSELNSALSLKKDSH